MYLVIVQAVLNSKMIRVTELIALLLCVVGSLILVIPDQLLRCTRCMLCMKKV